ncbi:hypothetical protein ACFVFS_25400 [Kitasatospora sp. NPDC057692]|uniref:SMODS domain-containing nucleotidyltransferase n=1 Tax=Kitasatospora sp. NPDC057692 TaxID=3346215 RepID=UPI0036CCB949
MSLHFDQFFQQIDLSEEESSIAIARAKNVAANLTHGKHRRDTVITGSIIRSTAVRHFSDVDIVASIGRYSNSESIDPHDALRRIERDLRKIYPSATISGNVVTVGFEEGLNVDVLPALSAEINAPGGPVFKIPSADHSHWEEYSPGRQDERVRVAARSSGEKLLRVIRLAKWWSRKNGGVIPSHEIETMACEALSGILPSFPRAVEKFFESALRLREFPPEIRSAILGAHSLARSANSALQQGNELRSIAYWRCLLGDKFPTVAR